MHIEKNLFQKQLFICILQIPGKTLEVELLFMKLEGVVMQRL